MNKEFEKQYRDYITEQVPDMWDRIEAGLKEKGAAEKSMTEAAFGKKNTVQVSGERRRVRRMNKAAIILVPAAAVVFLCFLVSPALLENRSKPEGGAMNASPARSEEWEFEAAENGGGADEKEGIKGNAGEDSGAAITAEEEAECAIVEDHVSMEEKPVEMQAFLRVRVRIDTVTQITDSEYDAMYFAEVLEVVGAGKDQTADPVLEGTKICFYVGEDTDKTEGEAPKTGEEYEVVLEAVPEEENYFAKKIYFIS